MKFPDIPGPPGRTPYERFRDLVKHVLSVPKAELEKREAENKRQRKKAKKTRVKQPP